MIPMDLSTGHAGRPLNVRRWRLCTRERYLLLLTWSFTFFSSMRLLSYLPGLWVIWQAQDSSQHSLLTWFTWMGANLTMAGWLYEHNGQRMNQAVFVNLVNTAMCAATLVLILVVRSGVH